MTPAERTREWKRRALEEAAQHQGEPCRCGCGEYAGVWHVTDRRKGWIRGEPKPYLKGHDKRLYNTPEERAAAKKRWCRDDYQRHREERLAAEKQARDSGAYREQRRQWRRGWTEEQREKDRARKRRWNRVHGNLPWRTIEDQWFLKVLLRDPCAYCGAPAEHLDHVVPQAHGGEHSTANAVGACARCNASKRHEPLLLFLWRING